MPTLNRQVDNNINDFWITGGTFVSDTNTLVVAGYWTPQSEIRYSGMRFTDITIPKGAIITQAYITITCSFADISTELKSRIGCEAVDNPSDFSAEDFASMRIRLRNHTVQVDWDDIPSWAADTEYNSPEIKTCVQAIVDRAGWASGNALVVLWDDDDERTATEITRQRRGYGHYYDNAKATKLTIVYTAAPVLERHYHLNVTKLDIPYEDLDKTKELHVLLKNLDPTAKIAGASGEVVIEIKYEPAA